jgi:hypothetical protein
VFGKLLFIIVAVCAVACALLVIRQQRIDTFHDMTQVHRRLLEHERTLWQMRADIAQRCRPSQVRLAMNGLHVNWVPLPARPTSPDVPEIRLATHPSTPGSAAGSER